MKRITVYAARYRSFDQELSERTIGEDQSLPKNYYYTKEEALVVLKQREEERRKQIQASAPVIKADLADKAAQINEILGDNYHLDYNEVSGVFSVYKETPFGIFEEEL